MFSKCLAIVCFSLVVIGNSQAQTTTQVKQGSKPAIRVTTRVTPLPEPRTPAEELADLETKLAAARQDPDRVADGTVLKYELVIEQKKQQMLAEEQKEKKQD